MNGMIGGVPSRALGWAIAAGVAIGVAYVLSPLTVVAGVAVIPLLSLGVRDLPADERRWVLALLATATALRGATVLALFLTANPQTGSFATFFGDEWFYQVGALRLYDLWMGLPISRESFLYAYYQIGDSRYQAVLAFLHVLVGPAPYGIHVLNGLLFLTGVTVMYRFARRSFGSAPALLGLAVLLFLPSLFAWSISALRESLYLVATVVVLVAALQMARASTPARKIGAALLVLMGARFIESMRPGGLALTLAGVGLGYALRLVTLRAWARATVAVAAVLAVAWVARFGLPARVDARLVEFATYSRGHVFTPGHAYKLLDEHFYTDYWGPRYLPHMTPGETTRYVVRAAANYVSQPVPWNIASRAELFYMPEQVLWYALVLLFPFGVVLAFKRDALFTLILAGYTVTNTAVFALNSGNIGTLVRHRALAVPYFVWLSAVAFAGLVRQKGSS